jgi:VanZ family protein
VNTGGNRWRRLWALIVFVLLTQPHLDDEGRQRLRFGVFELGHSAFFGVLGFLLSHALMRVQLRRFVWWTVVLLTLYGIIGELLQATVPGRSPSITDVFADGLGAFVGATCLTVLARMSGGASLGRALRLWPRNRPAAPDLSLLEQSVLPAAEHRWNAE